MRFPPLAAAAFLLAAPPLAAQLTTPLDSASLALFRWRSIGPANMGGRITDIEGVPGDPKTFYVAAAAGGIWKTTNHGTTFQPVFDDQAVISMGDIAVAPSDPNVIYAGTGEEDSRNSISPGGGVYRSTDGGRSWRRVGLERTEAIGRIVVDPTDPDIAYVAALGHIWDTNPERGLYKTTDGGATWQLVKFISDRAGFVDVAIDPSDRNTLYAASWERLRGPYFLRSGGPGSGLWKSTDAGRTWTEIRGGGFPGTTKGRIGIAIAPSAPQTVYAIVEADTLPRGAYRRAAGDTARQRSPSGLYRSRDGGRTWERMNNRNNRPFYYSQVRVDPRNPDRVYWLATQFSFSDDGGKTVRTGGRGIHVDYHAMWIDPDDPDHYLLGSDGGISVTWDRGGTYDFINTLPLGQFYAVSFDMQKPYRVCGGLQDNGSWCGPSRTRDRITNADWFNVGGGDGFYTANDPTDPDIVYSESQGGNISRLDLSTGERTPLRSGNWAARRRMFEDSLVVARGDTTVPETPEVSRRLGEVRARIRADSLAFMRFNWNTPFFLSPHNPRTVYAAGNRVLKSVRRGEGFVPISPDLTTQDPERIRVSTQTTGGITRDVTGAETHATITALAESPLRPGILWAGTDDGRVWVTRNDGGDWTDLTGRFPGLPARTWVSRVEPSAFDSATVYVAFDGHRTNDFTPYLYVSTDFGRSFRSIAAGLPQDGPAFVHVVREDPRSRDLLYVGTDVAAYVSTDRGRTWQRFMNGLPAVPVHDLRVHPRDRELIAGTHGRSVWVVDVSPLQEMSDSVMAKRAHFFSAPPAYLYAPTFQSGSTGNKLFQGENPTFGASLAYRLGPGTPGDSVRLVVTDVRGDTVRVLRGPGGPGMHRVYWDLRGSMRPLSPAAARDSALAARRRAAQPDTARAQRADTARARQAEARRRAAEPNLRPAETPIGQEQQQAGGGQGMQARQGALVQPGEYLVTLEAAGERLRRTVRVEGPPPGAGEARATSPGEREGS
ncbi:MAG TPA: hypothetical protein VHG28_16615 [Longimicrobiaceae bacterium]|nr:hypothetical protein [Longimicrobiaceae bacterium]